MAFVSEAWIDMVLLIFMVVTALGVVATRSVFTSVMLMGIFSLLSAMLFVVLDAVDVAFTEAAVGAGISVVIFLCALGLIPSQDRPRRTLPLTSLAVCSACGALLIAGTLDMPHYGDSDAPIHTHVADRYISAAREETGVPNIVTAVLASYRGFDTLGETFVIFTAAIGIMVLLANSPAPQRKVPPPPEPPARPREEEGDA